MSTRSFDGIVVFGGVDWWYHNRGHYDVQLARRLARRLPVLYVNSIGMRAPSPAEGAMFARRVARKVRSWARGARDVEERLAVLSPVAPPGGGGRAARWLLAAQVRRAAGRRGIERPLVWTACPPAAELLDELPRAGLVHQRTDRMELYPGADTERVRAWDARLKERADLVLFASRLLFEEERGQCRNAAYLDHGVDYERFRDAALRADGPADVAAIPRPRAGFVGGIDAHTFDPDLFAAAARALPDVSFVLVGSCSLPAGWCDLPNVHRLGRRPYEDVARYMAACDVLLMPWNRSPWVEACNPVKLKEYLAVGRPVVSTPFPELAHYDGLVHVAATAPAFAAAVRRALTDPGDPTARRARVAAESWDSKAEALLHHLAAAGLVPAAEPLLPMRAGDISAGSFG